MDPLVTNAEFAGYLQRDLDRYTADLALAGASGLVRQFCRWPISRTTETFTLDGTGSTILTLPTLRLESVSALRVDGTPFTGYTTSTLGQLHRADGWPHGFRNIAVDATHGYASIPDEIRIVVCAIAARFYSNPEGLAAKSSGDGGRTFVGLSELEIGLIAGHRLT